MKNGTLFCQPLPGFSSLVAYCGERGFLGLAFHPNYGTNGYFYVNYTRASDGATVIARYQRLRREPRPGRPGQRCHPPDHPATLRQP